jgi:hypothetical protein
MSAICFISWLIGIGIGPFVLCLLSIADRLEDSKQEAIKLYCSKPFSISEYYTRMESIAIDIARNNSSIDNTITLWFGLHGIKLDGNKIEEVYRGKLNTDTTINTQFVNDISSPLLENRYQEFNISTIQQQVLNNTFQQQVLNNTLARQSMCTNDIKFYPINMVNSPYQNQIGAIDESGRQYYYSNGNYYNMNIMQLPKKQER